MLSINNEDLKTALKNDAKTSAIELVAKCKSVSKVISFLKILNSKLMHTPKDYL